MTERKINNVGQFGAFLELQHKIARHLVNIGDAKDLHDAKFNKIHSPEKLCSEVYRCFGTFNQAMSELSRDLDDHD